MAQDEKIVVIGAGPAGLTLAYELLKAGRNNVTVYECDKQVGGISKTIKHHGNRIDIGGHRFFSKSDWVMSWWKSFLPIAATNEQNVTLQYQGKERELLVGPQSPSTDDVMLVRSRLSRIYYNKTFFDYPLKLTPKNLTKLGLRKTIIFGLSYLWGRLDKITPELTLEDFFINRFGRKLYQQFFKDYTEKVWGVPCSSISADWGAQRVKSLSISSVLLHACKRALGLQKKSSTQTSLIEQFIYPKYGPGQMWETVARHITDMGGTILLNHQVNGIAFDNNRVSSIMVKNPDGSQENQKCDVLVSTMPIKDLVVASGNHFSPAVQLIAKNLQYRDFITVGLLYNSSEITRRLNDNWIYIQEPGVHVGRVQIFNNWSPYMVANPETTWLGLEFFCSEGNDLWMLSEQEMIKLACFEMKKIGLVSTLDALDSVVVRVPKAYPGYFGESYKSFGIVRDALNTVENLFLIGRNGMHCYNNQDHSMLTAKEAADQIISGQQDKDKLWKINIDDDYHEEKSN
ncbi:FAD-dependent oxidoreductase [Acetobacter lambici]|uniref:NAD(P)/FAD-dependent oxidoreductase n=1 Tax=Acetobacter lambici TaxID=1332824 RepID=A0ABT1F4X9_9PROT|nr:NAD(P)/FAD-dependent oxidoreductase [Acetobacter lambici]MCP1243099.1 NAD(P)/FAD-dependent oxidoreductase [Acetobacter lambici]MCP1259183.1 NAD(P)/FAD-dependent oxidoreductase [Acetobacter lambici]NHO56110.1 FAD-dependent oxidoreductase [Acetobacter lambici]